MYTLRSVTDNDFDFVKEVELGGLRPYITEVFGWDDEFQDQRFIDHWRTEGQSIICIDGEEVGLLEVREREGEVFLARLYIRADRRNRGIGSEIGGAVVERAHAQR
jgi:GNAT superfamily N-acetyltransferase